MAFNGLKTYSIRSIRQWVHYVSSITLYLGCNVSFHRKSESIQYSSALAITGAIRGTSTEKLYNELGLETHKKEDGTRNYAAFIKFLKVILQNTYLTLSPLP